MRYFLLLASSFIFFLAGNAQFTFDFSNFQKGIGIITDVRGNRPAANKYDKIVDGTPYLKDDWSTAELTDTGGKVYKDVLIKLDLFADKILYMDGAGNTLELLTPVMYFHMEDSLSGVKMKFIKADYFKESNDDILKGWMQLYETGSVFLLKQLKKVMNENTPFGSAVVEVRVMDYNSWILVVDAMAYPVKNIKDAEELLFKKDPRLKNFKYSKKGIEAQLVQLVSTYNSI